MWQPIVVAVVAIYLLYKITQRRHGKPNIWEENGIPFIDISKIANSMEFMLGLKDEFDIDQQVYEQMGKEKFTGIIEAGCPVLFVKDLDLAKTIMIKDFDHFTDRNVLFSDSNSTILKKMLPSLHGTEWRGVRQAMSPLFTSGKIRRIMQCFNRCSLEWVEWLKTKQGKVHMKNASGQYAVEVIANVVFGMSIGCIRNPNSEFVKNSIKLGDPSISLIIRQALALRFPKLLKFFRQDSYDTGTLRFFDELIGKTLKARENGEMPNTNDFLQLLVEAKKGNVKTEGSDELDSYEKDALLLGPTKLEALTDDILKGQGFVFFLAGQHGITTSVALAAHTLSLFPAIQKRLQDELDDKFTENQMINYDELTQLPYLDMFITELLRFYPITPRVLRVCTKAYEKPDLGLKIPKGAIIAISMLAIHHDNEHFENPDKFDPERFTSENKAKRHNYAYLAFGHGPRFCIGQRFALVEIKTAVAHLVKNFNIEPLPNASFPLRTKVVGHAIQIHGDDADVILTSRD